ncbi:MAG TPA: mitochondrial fission ELM1 family protein [Paracoccaceae bacterium]|nr:mitochondrial fission ELM1 family protein [Paracoccaceae bacterium]
MRGPVWLVTDGRAGNLNPARALARGLAAEGWGPAEARTLRLEGWASRLPAELWGLPGWSARWPLAALAEGDLARPWPALVVTAGRRSAPFGAALRALSGGRTRAVAILRPGLAAGRFDAVVTPSHDRMRGANVVETLGSLSAVTPEGAAEAGRALAARLGPGEGPRAAVLIGGPSRAARWREADGRALVAGLAALAREARPLVTGSRRTPAGLLEAVRAAAPTAWVWDGTGANPYPGVLGLAEAAVVTADSVNMASEAASAGLPVLVAEVSGLSAKLRRFHADLAAAGASRPFAGRLETWDVTPLREAERVAGVLARDYLGAVRDGGSDG